MYAVILVGAALVVGLGILGIAYVIVTRAKENGGGEPGGNDDGEE